MSPIGVGFSDVADWLRDGGTAHAGKIIRDLMEDYQPPVAPEPEPPADEEQYASPDEIRDNSRTTGWWGWSNSISCSG